MLQAIFHTWERKLASVTTDRVVRPFDWGLEWIPQNGSPADEPAAAIGRWVSHVMADTDAFYAPSSTDKYTLSAPSPEGDRLLTFPSALETPQRENNTVYCRLFPARGSGFASERSRSRPSRPRAAVLVLPQWNADPGGHVGLSRLLAMNGISALRLSMPYHDQRMPPELHASTVGLRSPRTDSSIRNS